LTHIHVQPALLLVFPGEAIKFKKNASVHAYMGTILKKIGLGQTVWQMEHTRSNACLVKNT